MTDHDKEAENQPSSSSSPPFAVRRLLIPIAILLLGAGITAFLMVMRKRPPRVAPEKRGMVVEVITAQVTSHRAKIVADGTIKPRREVALAPQISGKAVWINDKLMAGRFVRKGTPLLRIDSVDFELAVQRTRAAVAAAEQQLAEAQSNAQVARQEWKMLSKSSSNAAPNPLTLFEPQLKAAQATLVGAKADNEQAKINLSRTTLRSPFNARVRSKQVEVGQYVRVGEPITTLYGTDIAEIEVPVPLSELTWLELPKIINLADSPSTVIVRLRTGHQALEREGTLVRSLGAVDSGSRMSRVVINLRDPFNLEPAHKEFPADFEMGSFVEVEIEGKSVDNVIAIPTHALHIGSRVYLADKDDLVQIRQVSVARRNKNEVLITDGLSAGDRVVVTPIRGAISGMKLRIKTDNNPPAKHLSTASP